MKFLIDACHLNIHHTGGKEQFLFNLLKGFEAIGKAGEMTVLCFPDRAAWLETAAPSALFRKIPVSKAFLHKPGIRVGSRLDYRIGNFVLWRLVREAQPDAVFFPNCRTIGRKLDVPSIVNPHDVQTKNPGYIARFGSGSKKNVWLDTDFALRDAIIAISDYEARETAHYFPQYAHKIKRLYNPLDIALPQALAVPREKNIVAVNIQFPHKNVLTLIKAFEQIREQTEHRLLLVGRKSVHTLESEEYVKKRGLEDRICFTGFVTEEELNAYLRSCALYVNPSLYEGFGMTAVEAIVAGAPTLVSDVAASREVTMGLCEYYAPAEDQDVLAQRLLDCLKTPYDIKAAREKSRRLFKAYHLESIAEEYYGFFREIAEGRNRQ